MRMIPALFLGWPAIAIFLILATAGAWLSNQKAMLGGLVFSIGPSLYLIGYPSWVRLVGVLIPVCLFMAYILVREKKLLLARAIIVPIYCFYAWLANLVLTQ